MCPSILFQWQEAGEVAETDLPAPRTNGHVLRALELHAADRIPGRPEDGRAFGRVPFPVAHRHGRTSIRDDYRCLQLVGDGHTVCDQEEDQIRLR